MSVHWPEDFLLDTTSQALTPTSLLLLFFVLGSSTDSLIFLSLYARSEDIGARTLAWEFGKFRYGPFQFCHLRQISLLLWPQFPSAIKFIYYIIYDYLLYIIYHYTIYYYVATCPVFFSGQLEEEGL